MSSAHILIVEDDDDIAQVLRYNLEREGFAVECVARGDQALEAIREKRPALLLLDLMLPGIDGLDLTRLLKRDPATATVPIIMLTARGDEVDRIVGLELGADDYLAKPFSPREVVLRVKAVLRRTEAAAEPGERLRVGELEIDVPEHRVVVDGEPVELTATEFRLLKVLAERVGRVQSRAQLLTDVWAYSSDVDTRTVDTHVRRLRRKLGGTGARIETLIGVGYRLRD